MRVYVKFGGRGLALLVVLRRRGPAGARVVSPPPTPAVQLGPGAGWVIGVGVWLGLRG
jgi:hypothetical protein